MAKYMPKASDRPRRPPTATFDVLDVFFVLSLERRRALHVNVTRQPHAAWAAQQSIEALGDAPAPARLLRDRDAIFGAVFNARAAHLSIAQLKIAPRSYEMLGRTGRTP